MLNKRHNPVVTFFILLTLVGVSKPAKALSEVQNDGTMTSISEALPQQTRVKIATSNKSIVVNQSKSSYVTISSTEDSQSAWSSQSSNPPNLAAVALVQPEEFLEGEKAIAGSTNSILAVDRYTDKIDRSLNLVADSIDNSRSSINADRKLYANFDLKDSGEIDPNWKNSGQIDSNLKDSGEINFNVEGSEDLELDINLKDSGELNPDLEDSGEINLDLEDSGQTISFKIESSTIIAQANDNTVAPNGGEGDRIPPTREGQWWWWLPLIIGIPIIAAIIISNGQKKSDREPAIDNVRDLNTGDRGLGVSSTSGRENLSAVGTNVGNVNEQGNSISNSAQSINAATVAEGTATNFIDDRSRKDNIDLDIDRSDLEDTNSVAGIPSTSVSEFTGYETKLQSDSSTKLQDDNIDLDLIDDIPPINPIDNVAASELVADLDREESKTDFVVEVEKAVTDRKLDTNTLEPLNIQIVNSDRTSENTVNNIVEDLAANEDIEAKEFLGDYVLQEETQGFSPYQQADADLNLTQTTPTKEQGSDETLVSELDRTEQPASFVGEVSELDEPDVAVSEVDSDTDIISEEEQDTGESITNQETIEVVEFDNAVDLDTSEGSPSSDDLALSAADSQLLEQSNSQLQLDSELVEEQNNETLVSELDRTEQPASFVGEVSELDEPDVAVSEVDSDTDIISEPRQNTGELNTNQETIEVIGFDSDLYLEPTQTESSRLDSGDRISEATTDNNLTDNFEVVNISIDEIGFDDDSTQIIETNLDDDSTQTTETSIDEISFDDSELDEVSFDQSNDTNASFDEISFDDDSTQTIETSIDDDSTQTTETSIDEISFDDSELDEVSFDQSNDTNASIDEISFDDSELDEISLDESNDTNASLEEISFDDSELDEISFDNDSTQTIETSIDEISLDESNDTNASFDDSELDEISFDDSELEEISFDNDSTQTRSSLEEISLDESNDTNASFDEISFDDSELEEISFDDDSTQTRSSLDEISFDESNDTNASLDEISFDELDEISFDDDSTQTRSSLDEISFDESNDTNASLDEISFDELDESISLEEISFDNDSTQTIDASLEEISFDELDESVSTNKVDDFNSDEVGYEELDKARANSTLDLLSSSTAGIASLSDDESEDMNNITEWLESLETPQQNTDNILEWLDNLNTQDTNSVPKDRHDKVKSEETNDISFEFIEDLLDDDPKQDK